MKQCKTQLSQINSTYTEEKYNSCDVFLLINVCSTKGIAI
jgi:hypothetical protein